MQGAGPGGALQGYMKPNPNSKFMNLCVGNAVELASMRQEARMRIKEEYYNFRDRMTLLYGREPSFSSKLSITFSIGR